MYTTEYTVQATDDITAIEVNFLTFDIWGNYTKTLSATTIADLKAKEKKKFDAEWNIFSENEAEEYYASISYISQVRTKDGRVIKADRDTVIEEARKFSAKFSESDIDSKPGK